MGEGLILIFLYIYAHALHSNKLFFIQGNGRLRNEIPIDNEIRNFMDPTTILVDRVTYKNTKYCAGTESFVMIGSLGYLKFCPNCLVG